MYKVFHLKGDLDRLYGSRKNEEEDLPALKIVLTHQYNNSKTTYKSVEED